MTRTVGSPNITEKVTQAIISVKASNSTFSARQIMNYLKTNHLIYKLKERAIPRIRAIQGKVKNNLEEIERQRNDPLDKPWRISTLPLKEIPPQSLPKVLELFIEKLRTQAVHITIREAQWIGRLAFVFKDKEMLWQYALSCAWAEKILKYTGINYTEIGEDALLYEEMTGKSFSTDDLSHIRQHESLAEQKQIPMKIKGRKKKAAEAEGISSVVVHHNGKEVYRKSVAKGGTT